MADHATLRADLWQRLTALPRPVSRDQALDVARQALAGHPAELAQFTEWFEKHGDAVVEKIHGA